MVWPDKCRKFAGGKYWRRSTDDDVLAKSTSDGTGDEVLALTYWRKVTGDKVLA
ncbi:hypothetical protein OCU04_008414 [Sclerotinia nivalis]|uniref:Uncharacterized protein n=1 Tax=Sclerotinia nivalis TaxID=352851 RepID=A0A9X0AI94_9HELO|nr:hypothetical protein OCU04_008414 [Sclerotinia nivalis]